MRVHIVCSFLGTDRILPRLAKQLAHATGWTLGEQPDARADLNYYMPYLEMRKGVPGLSAAVFTHREDVLPGKVKIWKELAAKADLRITWASQYEDDLAQYGPTLRLSPPLDREHFKPDDFYQPDSTFRAGVSGYVYSGGRKGEALLADAVKRLPDDIDWTAIGRGWPVPTKTITYAELPAWYRSLDLYVCPSLIEGVPYGPLEALACGVPVVIPRGVGLLDDLPDDVGGIHRYEAGNADDLSGMIRVARNCVEADVIDRDVLRRSTEPYEPDAWLNGNRVAVEAMLGRNVEREERARASDHGIYVVAYGEPARDCAERLIRSIRQHMPETPVAVASERPLPSADVYVAHPDADVGGRTAKTKMWGLAPAEWQHVLYLDADTELTAPVGFLFDALRDGFELVMTHDVKDYNSADERNYTMIYSLWRRDNQEHEAGIEALGSDRALQLAGGVCGFRRTPDVEAFLAAWYDEWFKLGRRDQGALVRALYRHPLRMLTLGNEWNTFEGICRETTAGIVHHRGGPARRVSGWIPGRLDEPSAWQRTRLPQTATYRGRGFEGVIEAPRKRQYHASATVELVYTGPQLLKRVAGRTGRNYAFRDEQPLTVSAEDAAQIASDENLWEVRDMNCPVCGAPDGVCKGDDIEVKESGFMFSNQPTEPMRLPRQHTRRGRAGYVGEEDGRVQTFDPPVRSENGGAIPVDLQRRLDAMDDEALAGLGLQRIQTETKTEDDGEKKKRKAAPANKRRKAATLRTKRKE